MSDTAVQPEQAGVRFPFINLEKAISRARMLYDADHQGREMPVATAFEIWNYSTKSSGGHQTVGALKMYDLLRDSGTLDSRKVALTGNALRYFRDEREEERAKLLRQFALAPKMFASLWQHWQATPPADTVARSHLKIERNLGEQNARAVLATYKENLAFANLKGADKIQEVAPEQSAAQTPYPPAPKVKIGDYIQWTSAGVDQFNPPRQVEWISDDGVYLRVFGSPGGIPMNEVTAVPAPGVPKATPLAKEPVAQPAPAHQSGATATTKPEITAYVVGGRLQITADVDKDGIEKLEQMLAKYKEILALLN